LIFSVFGMGSYTPYAIAAIVVHLTIVSFTFVLLRRVGAGAWIAVMTALVVAFFGLGANAEIYAASMNHTGALLFGVVCAYLAATGDLTLRRQALVSMSLLASIMFGLTGLAMFAFVGTFVAARHTVIRAARCVAPPAVVFVAWFLLSGRSSGIYSVTPQTDLTSTIPAIPGYVWAGLTGTLGEGSGLTGAGPILVGILIAGLALYTGENRPLLHLAWAGVVADIFQLVIVGVARFDFGPTQLGTSHYSYINIVLLAPAIALVGTMLSRFRGRPRARAAVLAAILFVAYALNGVTYLRKWQDDFTLLTGGGRNIALGIKAGVANGQKVLTQRNPDPYNTHLIPRYVATPQILRSLPDRQPSEQGRLNADSYFFTGVGTTDYQMAGPSTVTPYAGLAEGTLVSGCQRVRTTAPEPILQVVTGDAGTEIVLWSDSTTIKTRLVRGDVEGPTMDW
jgi:hypothetical protein